MTARQRNRVEALWPVTKVDQSGPTSWMLGAPCNSDPELFTSDEPADTEAAKNICLSDCPLVRRIACMDYAFDNDIDSGTWGGVTSLERTDQTTAA